jgi:YggT family protein
MEDITYLVIATVSNSIRLYLFLIFARILLSWFQTAEWAGNIISFLAPVTDPYLNIFRSFIPPLGGIDFSAILAIFVLQLILGLA